MFWTLYPKTCPKTFQALLAPKLTVPYCRQLAWVEGSKVMGGGGVRPNA